MVRNWSDVRKKIQQIDNAKLQKAPAKKEFIDEKQVALAIGGALARTEALEGIAELFCVMLRFPK